MRPQIRFNNAIFGRWLAGLASLFVLVFMSPLAAQENQANQVIRSEVKHTGTALVRSVTKDSGFFPDRQPEVYWHGDDWTIDLLPLSSPDAAFTVRIISGNGREKIVTLPDRLAQIDSILRTPNDKAIITAELGGMTQALCIVDLKEGKVIDKIGLYDPIVSPDQRFILYNNWYPPHVGGENMYRLYDVLKTPKENTCGYEANDPLHRHLSDDLRGFQVYPQRPGQIDCTDVDDDDDNQAVSDFIWSSDSSKIVFADVKNSVLSLILVKMPGDQRDRDNRDNEDRGVMDEHGMDRDRRDLPQTSIYTFTGADDVCAGAASCDYNNVKSVAWNGDAVNVALIQANPGGKAIEKDLTIPLTKFVPISNHRDHETGPGRHDGDHSDQGPGHE